jgi:1-acyl-sn-glycerol-3-phosphate acyltransferase
VADPKSHDLNSTEKLIEQKELGTNSSQKNGSMPESVIKDNIPYPHLESWMHKRIPIPRMTSEEKNQLYYDDNPWVRFAISLTTRLLKFTKLAKGNNVWITYRIVMSFIYFFYRIRNRLEVRGRHNIPKKGAIFIINHIAGQDVVFPFMAAFRKPISVFTDMGPGFFSEVTDKYLNFVTRRGSPSILIEKMIRNMLLKNRYFAMWPEGTLERHGKIMHGLSGIAKVYATINSQKDIVPFVPVHMTESAHKQKIIYTIFKPRFIPRDWLKTPEQGGKTPREIIDYVMMILAQANKQANLDRNHLMEHRRKHPGKAWHG